MTHFANDSRPLCGASDTDITQAIELVTCIYCLRLAVAEESNRFGFYEEALKQIQSAFDEVQINIEGVMLERQEQTIRAEIAEQALKEILRENVMSKPRSRGDCDSKELRERAEKAEQDLYNLRVELEKMRKEQKELRTSHEALKHRIFKDQD